MHNSSIGDGLAKILAKGLALRSNERFQTARDLREALRSVTNQVAKIEEESDAGCVGAARSGEDTFVPDLPSSNKQLQLNYWIDLSRRLRSSNGVVRLQQARPYFSLSGPLGDNRVQLFATVHVGKTTICVGVRILNRTDLYRVLRDDRETIEEEIAEATKDRELNFDWRLGKKFQTVSEIWLCRYGSDIRDHESRESCLAWHIEKLEAIYHAFHKKDSGLRSISTFTDYSESFNINTPACTTILGWISEEGSKQTRLLPKQTLPT